MAVGILLVTHDRIGDALLESLCAILGELPLTTEVLSVTTDADFDDTVQRAKSLCSKLDSGDGVLILTDLYAATPDNIADLCCDSDKIRVVSGVNLSALIKIMNYHQLPLADLTDKAKNGGVTGIREHSL